MEFNAYNKERKENRSVEEKWRGLRERGGEILQFQSLPPWAPETPPCLGHTPSHKSES